MDFFHELKVSHPELSDTLGQAQERFILYLIAIQFIFSVVVLIIFIFFTHKIAGPLFKLKGHLQQIRDGEPITALNFRNGDYFHDVAEEVSEFLDSVAMNQETDFKFIDEVNIYLDNLSGVIPEDKKPVLKEIGTRLSEIQNRYRAP